MYDNDLMAKQADIRRPSTGALASMERPEMTEQQKKEQTVSFLCSLISGHTNHYDHGNDVLSREIANLRNFGVERLKEFIN